MAYTLNFGESEFRGGKNILASEHLQYIEGGATLDADAFGDTYVEVGTAIARDTATGKFVPYTDEATGLDEHSILNIDVDMDGVHDAIVGEVIVRGSVYNDKLPDNVTDAFKDANPHIRYVRHIAG